MHNSYYVMTAFSATIQVQLLCSLGSHCSLCCCAPISTDTCAGQGKAAAERGRCCSPGSVLLHPQPCFQHQMCSSHVQFLPKVPSIHPRDGREQKRLVPLPLSCLGLLAAAVVVAKWAVEEVHGRDVCQAPTFHSNLQRHFSSYL